MIYQYHHVTFIRAVEVLLKVQFRNGYQQFWLQKDIPVTYPALWNIARKFLIAFPSSYLVKRGFIVANLITNKKKKQTGHH